MAKKKHTKTEVKTPDGRYSEVLASMVGLLESARHASARAVNSIMTATYWEIGRRIVELEQGGEERAKYGEDIVKRLATDLTARFGRGFTWDNLYRMRRFYLAYSEILATVSPKFETDSDGVSEKRIWGQCPQNQHRESQRSKNLPTASVTSQPFSDTNLTVLQAIGACFQLPWSHFVKLLSIDDKNARRFYEEEALRGGWSVRQLNQ